MNVVFTQEWVSEISARFEHRPIYERPRTYSIATGDRFRELRSEIELWVSALPPEAQETLIPRLRDSEQFTQTYHELVIGAVLKEKLGFEAEYEVAHGKLTPDWTITATRKYIPLFVVEVFTDNPPKDAIAADKQWTYLISRLREIELAYDLYVRAPPYAEAPNQKASKRIAVQVRRWLTNSTPSTGQFITTPSGIVVEVIGIDNKCQRVVVATSPQVFSIHHEPLRKKIAKKIESYKSLGKKLPFVVGIVPTFDTHRDVDDFENALLGTQATRLFFNDADQVIYTEPVRENDGAFSPQNNTLSAALWVWKELGDWQLRAVHNPYASNPLPPDTFDVC